MLKKLVQSTLKKFGLRLVRRDVLASYGVDCFFAILEGFDYHPKHIIDVGANRGAWTRKVLTYFPEAHYTLVEPQDHLKVHIQDLLDRNCKITWINAGAADKAGMLPFTSLSRLGRLPARSPREAHRCSGISVPVMTLNEIVSASSAPPPEIVKIDAEGFDLKVLAGASDLLGKTDIFFVEVTICSPVRGTPIARVVRRMDEVGCLVVDITDIHRSPTDAVLWLCELAFLRNGSPVFWSATTNVPPQARRTNT